MYNYNYIKIENKKNFDFCEKVYYMYYIRKEIDPWAMIQLSNMLR